MALWGIEHAIFSQIDLAHPITMFKRADIIQIWQPIDDEKAIHKVDEVALASLEEALMKGL